MRHLLARCYEGITRSSRQHSGRRELYLERWHLLHTPWFRVYLHRFVLPDDACMHDHPWRFVSVILSGGYWEAVDCGTRIEERWRGAGSVAYRPATHIHRVAALDPKRQTWSLIITGPKERAWGFWTPVGWIYYLEYESERDC